TGNREPYLRFRIERVRIVLFKSKTFRNNIRNFFHSHNVGEWSLPHAVAARTDEHRTIHDRERICVVRYREPDGNLCPCRAEIRADKDAVVRAASKQACPEPQELRGPSTGGEVCHGRPVRSIVGGLVHFIRVSTSCEKCRTQ